MPADPVRGRRWVDRRRTLKAVVVACALVSDLLADMGAHEPYVLTPKGEIRGRHPPTGSTRPRASEAWVRRAGSGQRLRRRPVQHLVALAWWSRSSNGFAGTGRADGGWAGAGRSEVPHRPAAALRFVSNVSFDRWKVPIDQYLTALPSILDT